MHPQSDTTRPNIVIFNPAAADLEREMEQRLLDFFMTTADVLPHQQDSRRM